MSSPNPILDGSNARLLISNLYGATNFPQDRDSLDALPLGTPADSPTGPIGLKVHVLSAPVPTTGGTLTAVGSLVTTSGTVAAGKHFVEFVISTDFAGTINGLTYSGAADGGVSFGPIEGYTFAAINYTISAGSARLTTY